MADIQAVYEKHARAFMDRDAKTRVSPRLTFLRASLPSEECRYCGGRRGTARTCEGCGA